MRIFKMLGAKVLAGALMLSVLPAAIPASVPVLGIAQAEAGHRYLEHRHYHDGYYRSGSHYRPYYRRNNGGAAIAGAIVGLGIGAAIASANQPRYYDRSYRYYDAPPRYYRAAPAYGRYAFRSPAWYDYCAARYRSFDPRSGTFQPNHGPRRLCR